MSNCFREGKYIVVPYPNAQFPNRCVMTNREVDAADYKVVFSLPPHMQKGYRDSHIQLIEASWSMNAQFPLPQNLIQIHLLL